MIPQYIRMPPFSGLRLYNISFYQFIIFGYRIFTVLRNKIYNIKVTRKKP